MSRIGQLAPYLDGIPVVANSTQRDALFPSPDTHQRVWNLETGYLERYTGSIWAQEIPMGSAGAVVNVRAFGAKGDGSSDDTTQIHATRDVAGAKVIVFPPGTYITTGLTMNVAGQQWYLMQGATVKLKNASNTNLINISAIDGPQIVGYGILDGNRANQSSGTPFGIYITGATNVLIGDGLTLQNCKDVGINWTSVTGLKVRSMKLSGNGPASANYAQIHNYSLAGNCSDLVFEDLDLDGTPFHNGGMKVQAFSGFTVKNVSLLGIRVKCGGVLGGGGTLGVELFTVSAGLLQGIVLNNIEVVGEDPTFAIFGVSIAGDSTNTDTEGVRDVAGSGIRVKDCKTISLEIIASNVAISDVSSYNSGHLSISGHAVTGGIRNVAIRGYVADKAQDANYHVYFGGDNSATTGVQNCIVSDVIIARPQTAAALIQFGAPGEPSVVLKNIKLSRVRAYGMPALAVGGIGVGGTLTDSEITDVSLDLTGSAGAVDGVTLNNAAVARVKFDRMRIIAAPRHGINHNALTTDVECYGVYISGCGSDGIKTQAACTGMVIDGCRTDSNGGTGIILGASPSVKQFTNNRALGNVTAQINKGSATFTGTPRGNQSTTGVASGRAVLVGGTVTVNTAEVIAADNITLNRVVTGGTQGTLTVGTITAGTSFVITSSSGTDTSTVFWEIVH